MPDVVLFDAEVTFRGSRMGLVWTLGHSNTVLECHSSSCVVSVGFLESFMQIGLSIKIGNTY
jgi:hypothetical protein